MENKSSTWILLAIVVMIFAVGFYYYDAEASATEVELVEEVQAEIPAQQAEMPEGAKPPDGKKGKKAPQQASPPR